MLTINEKKRSGSSIPTLMNTVPLANSMNERKLALSDYIETHYPFVDVEISTENEASLTEGTLKVLESIFPEGVGDYKMKQYTDGITNKLFKVVTTSNNHPPLLVRVYGLNTEMLIDREQEILTMEILWEAKIAPPIYGRFRNGLCYGYLAGKTFSVEDMKCEVKLPCVANELARFHAVNVIGKSYREPAVFLTINNWIDVASSSPSASTPEINNAIMEIVNEFQFLRNKMEATLPSAKICFCHNDLLCKNILYSEADTAIDSQLSGSSSSPLKVRFIDYEYGNYNYAAFDIGNFFNEMMGYDVDVSLYPSKDLQLSFLTTYVNSFRQSSSYDHTMNPNHILSIEEEVKVLYSQVNKFALLSHIFWAIWARVQAVYSDISTFDYNNYSEIRMNAYKHFKEEFLAL